MRFSLAAWQLLQRLDQASTCLMFCREDGRFHFTIRDVRCDLVRPSTIEWLSKYGMIRRERFSLPSYVISDKGMSALKSRLSPADLDGDTPERNAHGCSQTIS